MSWNGHCSKKKRRNSKAKDNVANRLHAVCSNRKKKMLKAFQTCMPRFSSLFLKKKRTWSIHGKSLFGLNSTKFRSMLEWMLKGYVSFLASNHGMMCRAIKKYSLNRTLFLINKFLNFFEHQMSLASVFISLLFRV